MHSTNQICMVIITSICNMISGRVRNTTLSTCGVDCH